MRWWRRGRPPEGKIVVYCLGCRGELSSSGLAVFERQLEEASGEADRQGRTEAAELLALCALSIETLTSGEDFSRRMYWC